MPDFPTMARDIWRRLILAAVVAACLAPAGVMAEWKLVKISGRDFVPGSDIKDFYAFQSYRVKGNDVLFQLPNFWMRGTIGSKDISIKGIKFVMSLPLMKRGDEALFSRTDLVKLIDPVLRPDYIKGVPDFDTVVLDAGHGGHDSGAKGTSGFEKNFALKTALMAGAI